eukprot:gene24258-32692_t
MATCSAAGCACRTLYTDWNIGQRSGDCEDCHHLKTMHSREIAQPGGLIGRAQSVQLNSGYPAATYNITSFREIGTLPPRTASSLKFRIMKGPKNVRKRVAANIVDIERRSGTIMRGYVRRTVNEYVEVVLVTAPTTEEELAKLMTPFILGWPVDIDNIRFEQSNVADAHFLDANKFQFHKIYDLLFLPASITVDEVPHPGHGLRPYHLQELRSRLGKAKYNHLFNMSQVNTLRSCWPTKHFALCEAFTLLKHPQLSTEEPNKVHKAIAEQKMKKNLSHYSEGARRVQSIGMERKVERVAQYIAQINREISPLHASMQAKVTSIHTSVDSLSTICDDANANIHPSRIRNANSHNSYARHVNNADFVVAPSVVVPEMPPSSFVAAPQFVRCP